MFCFQCQEARDCTGCVTKGVCGKEPATAQLQDLVIEACRGLAVVVAEAGAAGDDLKRVGHLLEDALFATITNANFDDDAIEAVARAVLEERDRLAAGLSDRDALPACATFSLSSDRGQVLAAAAGMGILTIENEDVRSLRELLIYGLKGMAAYSHHARVLGKEDPAIHQFAVEALVSTTQDLTVDQMVGLVMKAGEVSVTTMALLDEANTEAYGSPELSQVNLGVRDRPGILVSGHDLRDLEDLLAQTAGTGVDVYTHCEMLPAHSYPAFKKHDHLVGNYGGSWWRQSGEFEAFNGPILMTTNCITPVRDSYRDRIFTTGTTGYPGVTHIPDRPEGAQKDFSQLIELAKTCPPPKSLEEGTITAGFAHDQVLALADKVVEAVESGAIKRFVVMAGCDGRQPERRYFTEVAEQLPEGTVILTAGCAKFRYNKLDLGDIGGIPRVLDAGQCNDSYSLALVALKLVEVFGAESINDLPISFDIAWYEQKACTVLLALLHLGVKGIRLGPTLPAFLSPNVAKVLVENFDIKPTGEVAADIEAMMAAA